MAAGRDNRAAPVPRTLRSPRHEALTALLIKERLAAGMTQAELAKKLGQYQSFVARAESGQRRLDVVEFLDFSEAIGFDARAMLRKLQTLPKR